MSGAHTERQLTPEARIERAKKLIGEAVSELVEAMLARGSAPSEWIDQNHSPLGRRRHLELVRAGKLAARKDGKKVLVRRDEINRYLDTERVVIPTQKPVGLDEVDAMVNELLAGGTK
jgi:hypothetical protein